MMNILSKPISCLAVMLSLAAVLATTVTTVSYTHLTLPTNREV